MNEVQVIVEDGTGPFWEGVEAGQFPRHVASGGAADTAVTSGSSHWLDTRCATCNHTFRSGDKVRVGADGAVSHLDPALRCRPSGPAEDEQPAELADQPGPDGTEAVADDEFVDGLLLAWPPADDAPVFLLGPGDWQVTTPDSGPTSLTCSVCGHTFRSGDTVIICPCAGADRDPLRRTDCQFTVHRDPARGLCCWDEWAPDGTLDRCPRTLLRISR